MHKESWVVVTFVLFIVSLYDSIRRHLVFSEATFVFSTALLYYNFVWIATKYIRESEVKTYTDILLATSICIGLVGYFTEDLW